MPPLDFEKIKTEGLQVDILRYTQEGYETIKPDDYYRLKTFGACTQRHEGYFMVRIRIPGGVIDAAQLEKIASLAARFGQGWGHLTTRGNIELHSVKINDFLLIVDELNEVGITTRSSCGHTFRNILSCHRNGACQKQCLDLQPWVLKVHQHVFEKAEEYNRRLPRRLNVSFSGCGGCSGDAQVNDIGFVSTKKGGEGSEVYGFELWAAGSLGAAPRLGYLLKDFIGFEEVLPSLEAITEIYCQHGERKNPAKARLKFLVESWGLQKFREEFDKVQQQFLSKQTPLEKEFLESLLLEPVTQEETAALGEGIYPERKAGHSRIEFWAPLGELTAKQMNQMAACSRQFADGKAYLTARQNFEFHGVKKEWTAELLQAMHAFGLSPKNAEGIMNVVSCPGTSFCALAVTSSQGAAKVLMKEFKNLEMDQDPALKNLSINISGCPNSCAKHQVSDIGFAGGMTEIGGVRRFGYQLFVGGRLEEKVSGGTMIKKGIPDDLVFPTAESLLEIFKVKKNPAEKFSDFVERIGVSHVTRLLEERLHKKHPAAIQSPIDMQPYAAEEAAESQDGIMAGAVEDWNERSSKRVQVQGEEAAVFKTPKGFQACQNICPHSGGSLADGENNGDAVTCPLHGWQFDSKTGACLNEPGNDIKIYKTKMKEGKVYLQ